MSIVRDITTKAQKYLKNPEINLFIGARQVGKTTILKQIKNILDDSGEKTWFLNLEDPDYLRLLNESPKNLFKIFTIDLKKKNYIFIDEIQYLDNPTRFLKFMYDEYQPGLKLLVSGSSAFYLDEKFKDSLAGRKRIYPVRTLSFREFLRFKNEQELAKKDFFKISLTEKEKIIRHYNEFMVYGGYPRVVLSDPEEKKDILQELAYSYIKKDLYDANVRHSEIFYKLYKILADGVGNLVNANELASTLHISKTAVDNYLAIMQKTFHICLVKPFFSNIRKELTKMPKVYFYDLGLRNFFVNNFEPYALRQDKGFLLENALFRQFMEKYDEEEIKFWRTTAGNEVDFVIQEKSAYEVKANAEKFNNAKYKIFKENYPSINLKPVSFRGKAESECLEAWML